MQQRLQLLVVQLPRAVLHQLLHCRLLERLVGSSSSITSSCRKATCRKPSSNNSSPISSRSQEG
jgi:hypothetical protein